MSVVRSALRSASLAFVALSTAMAGVAGHALPIAQQTTDCRLTVVAVNRETGKPVAGVGLRLTFVPPAAEAALAQAQAAQSGATILHEAYSADTDARGVAVFDELRAGRYNIAVSAPPGLSAPSATRLFDLAEHQSGSLTIPLTRPGTITGRVIADGRPVSGVRLVPLHWGGPAGGPAQLVPVAIPSSAPIVAGRAAGIPTAPPVLAGSTVKVPPPTGRDGRFGFANLPPGEYFLMAETAYVPNHRPEFAPTYFPGSNLIKDAKPIAVRAGEESSNIEIALVRLKTGHVTVKAFGSNGTALQFGALPGSARVSLMPVSEDRARPQIVAAQTRNASGNSLEYDVPPGDYYAVARVMTDEDPGTGERPRGSSSDGRRFWDAEVGYEPVAVKEGDNLSVAVRTNAGATVSGRVRFEEGPVTDNASARQDLAIVARPETYPRSPLVMTAQTSVVRDGAFTLKSLHGPIRLSVQGGAVAVKSIMRGSEDVTGKVLEFKGSERVNDVVIVVSGTTARLEGSVQGLDAEGGMVILFPEDRARWLPGAARVQVARVIRSVDGNGTAPFAFASLLPGRYYVVALNDTSIVAPIEPQSLEKLSAQASPITLQPAETRKVPLQVTR